MALMRRPLNSAMSETFLRQTMFRGVADWAKSGIRFCLAKSSRHFGQATKKASLSAPRVAKVSVPKPVKPASRLA